jgi:hypothetical protein
MIDSSEIEGQVVQNKKAIVLQAVIFATTHLFYRGIFVSLVAFWSGSIMGSWRINFRSLLPLILAHIILNAVGNVNSLKIIYHVASWMSEYDSKLDWEKIWSTSQCQQIILLRDEPADKAVPAIIGDFADPDEGVRIVAQSEIISKYRRYAKPFINEALTS